MTSALRSSGCRILHESEPDRAPFVITFERPDGERQGIVAYAFLANQKATRNRPADEHRFQIKYASKVHGALHDLWQDPCGLYTTLLVGINPSRGFFVGADPVLHSPTRFFVSLEFKEDHVQEVIRRGWHAWERERRHADADPSPEEVLVGGTSEWFLRYVALEREALGEDQGHRKLLAERLAERKGTLATAAAVPPMDAAVEPRRLHALARELALDESEVLDLIANARRLKMAVRGWVAEEHLVRRLRSVPGVTECRRLDLEGSPDVALRFAGRPLRVECKNVLRDRTKDGLVRLDFQRTRASKADPCSRYYGPRDFDVVAACLHAVTERWEFRYALTRALDPHRSCAGKLSQNVRLDNRWAEDEQRILREATGAR
jgi:hypothetical protein